MPQIKTMAGQLLTQNQEEVQKLESAFAPIDDDIADGSLNGSNPSASSAGQNFHQDLLSAIEKSIETVNGQDVIEDFSPTTQTKSNASSNKGEPVSPGIRNLISRIENAVGEDFLEPQSASDAEEEVEDDLTQDLREIEALREELHGLRHRIAAGA